MLNQSNQIAKKAILLSFLSGFLSLGLEVIWIRLFGFFTGGLPQAFSITLALFLLGIAIGSLIGKQVCQEGKGTIEYIGKIFLLSAVLDCLAISLFVFLSNKFAFGLFILCIFFCALFRGIVFPIVHHLGSENKKTGASISNVYFANVLGCTISPIFIGFYLLDIFTTQQTYLIIIAITLITAFFCLQKAVVKVADFALLVIVVATAFVVPEKMITALAQKENATLERIIENKHGFIQVYTNENNDKLVLGGNAYDGMLNVDLNHSHNGIERAYLIPVIAPKAKNILVIGLSTGSWVRVLTTMPEIESITVVELNPGYPKLVTMYSEMQHLLADKRVHLITDDGRRWLNKNPNSKFDFILMNTTFHWRSYSSNLLSQQFQTLAKEHLAEDGFIYFNTTSSYDAFYTSKSVFPYVYQYLNMSLASLKPIPEMTQQSITSTFAKLKWDGGEPVFNAQNLTQGVERIYKNPLIPYDKIDFSSLGRNPEIIRDENMITEYKYGLFSDESRKRF